MPLTERSRRWIRRIVYTSLGIPAAGALVLFVYIRTGHPDELARKLLSDALGNFLGRPVTIESVELRYLPPGLIVTGFRSEHPLIEASRMEVAVSPRALLRGRVAITDVDLFDPLIEWDLDTEHFRREVTGPPAPAPGQGRFASRVDLRRLRIHHARIMIGSEIRELSAEMEGLRLHADNQEVGFKGPWAGAVVFSRGRFVLGDLEVDGVAGSFAFEADPASIHTRRLTLKTEGIDIRATGQVQPGTPTRGRFEADMRLDPESTSLHRPLPQISAKNLACELTLMLPGDGVRVSGSFTTDQPSIDADRDRGPDGQIVDGPLSAWVATQGTGTFLVESGRIEVQTTLAGLAGGRVEAGYVGVKHGAGDDTPREHQITILATQLNLHDVLRNFELPGRQEITPSALVSGDATVRWVGDQSDQMKGSAELIFDRAEGNLPVWGAATIAWRGRRVTVEASSLTTEGSSVTLNGTIDGATVQPSLVLTARIVSTDTNPVATFLGARFPALGAAKLTPSDVSGGIEADLHIGGTTVRPVIEATFSSNGVAASLPTASIALDSATGTLSYRNDLLALNLTRLEGTDLSAHGSLRVNPSTGEILAAELEARVVPADLLARLAGIDPVKLPASGTLQAGARYAQGEGQFELSAEAVSLGAMQFSAFDARARLTGRQLHLDQGSVSFCGGKISAEGSVDLGGDHPDGGIDFSVSGVDLSKVDAAYPGPEMTGSFDADGRLTFGAATGVEATLTGRDIHISGTDLGAMIGTLSGSINSPQDPLLLDLKDDNGGITVAAKLSADAMLDGEVRVRGFSLEEVRPLVPPGSLRGLEGDADGVITFDGPLMDPASLVVVALIDRVSLTVGEDGLTNEEPVRLTIQDGFLTLAPMRLMGERTDLTLGGSMTLTGTYDITARVAGTYDLAMAELLFPEMSASGNGTADLHVTERGDLLSYDGTITLERGTIRHPSLPLPLENLRGRGEFTEQGQLTITELLYDIGGGHVSGTGFVRFEGASVPAIHLALSGKGMRSEIFPDMRAFF